MDLILTGLVLLILLFAFLAAGVWVALALAGSPAATAGTSLVCDGNLVSKGASKADDKNGSKKKKRKRRR